MPHLSLGVKTMSASKSGGPIRVAVLGQGRSGLDIHCNWFRRSPAKYRIVAVSDILGDRRERAARELKCDAYADYRALLARDDVELVVNSLPSHLHPQASIDALKSGHHVVCEKPLGWSVTEVDRMIRTAAQADRILAPFQQSRYSPPFQRMLQVIESGVLGRLVQLNLSFSGFGRRWDWQTLKKYDGGSLNNTGPHPVDQALILFGDKEPRVFCIREKTLTLGDAEDHVKLVLSGPGSPTVEIEIMSDCAYPQDHWLVMGTQGGLSGTPAKLQWKYFIPADLPKREVDERPTPDRDYNREKIPFKEESWSVENDQGPGETGFYLDLYESIRNNQPLVIRPEETRRQIWVMEECRKQAPI
jgi:predicted dehydrogenase